MKSAKRNVSCKVGSVTRTLKYNFFNEKNRHVLGACMCRLGVKFIQSLLNSKYLGQSAYFKSRHYNIIFKL